MGKLAKKTPRSGTTTIIIIVVIYFFKTMDFFLLFNFRYIVRREAFLARTIPM